MTPTELKLTAIHQGPVVRLADVCEKYLHLTYPEAQRRAALNQLPFPTFRLGTRKAPLMVNISDLARVLDEAAAEAAREWERSQV